MINNNNALITNKISNLESKLFNDTFNNETWVEQCFTKNEESIDKEYAKIFKEYKHDRKWILMINPDQKSLERLTLNKMINVENVLCVYSEKNKLNMANVKSALCKGNCSTVVLCNSDISQAELNAISKCAEQGKTSCVLLNQANTIH